MLSKFSKSLVLCALSLTYTYADAPSGIEEFMPDITTEVVAPPVSIVPVVEQPVAAPVQPVAKAKVIKAPAKPFSPFTGKVSARKVRMRMQPDVESHIIRELNKNDLISVVGEEENFWVVEPPAGAKAYVFRSFILDNVVEGNRVNVRLEPSLEAPVIGHLNGGERIQGVISALNNKWMEIAPPSHTHFYIAKEYVNYAGGPEFKEQIDKRRSSAEQLLDATALLSKAELRKSFDEVDFDRICKSFNTIITDYSEFSEYADQAKEALATFQEAYIQKRISHIELQSEEALVAATSSKKFFGKGKNTPKIGMSDVLVQITDKMKMWEPVEESLYLSWTNVNDSHNIQQFYDDQKLTAETVSGILEPYNSPVKSKPGDFIVRDKDVPVAYVYSTCVNLQNLVGEKVTFIASPRPNNNFAFPAFYVLSAE